MLQNNVYLCLFVRLPISLSFHDAHSEMFIADPSGHYCPALTERASGNVPWTSVTCDEDIHWTMLRRLINQQTDVEITLKLNHPLIPIQSMNSALSKLNHPLIPIQSMNSALSPRQTPFGRVWQPHASSFSLPWSPIMSNYEPFLASTRKNEDKVGYVNECEWSVSRPFSIQCSRCFQSPGATLRTSVPCLSAAAYVREYVQLDVRIQRIHER